MIQQDLDLSTAYQGLRYRQHFHRQHGIVAAVPHWAPQRLRDDAAARLDWQSLSAIWQRRFEQLPPPATSP